MHSKSFLISEYHESNFNEVLYLFKHTITSSCFKDYSKEEIDAWQNVDEEKLSNTLKCSNSFVCMDENKIIAFANATDGYMDCLYVAPSYQRKGIATMLCNRLEKSMTSKKIEVHASRTALKFFEKRGYKLIRS